MTNTAFLKIVDETHEISTISNPNLPQLDPSTLHNIDQTHANNNTVWFTRSMKSTQFFKTTTWNINMFKSWRSTAPNPWFTHSPKHGWNRKNITIHQNNITMAQHKLSFVLWTGPVAPPRCSERAQHAPKDFPSDSREPSEPKTTIENTCKYK